MNNLKTMISSESVEQQKLFAWAEIARMIPEYKGIELMYHIPNEGKRSNYTGGKMKKEGMKNGVSDVCLPLARGIYHGFYIEMKYGKNKLTDEQLLFLKGVKKQGYATAVCYTAEEAIRKLKLYFQLNEYQEATNGN